MTMTVTQEILLDPRLVEFAGALDPVGAVRCFPGGELLESARPGAVAVVADPRPELVEILVLWGVTVVAVRRTAEGSAGWLADVVDAGAAAALVRPDDEALVRALDTLLHGGRPW
jgi:hypothetical protein